MKVYDLEDTIAAVATPPGEGGIGIIRISGPLSLQKALKIFRPRKPRETYESHRLYYGDVIDPKDGSIIDEVLLSYMKSPRSFTAEDVVEINCHGSSAVLQKIMELLFAEGVREAGPGEFTKRAFLNGKLDLSQAEAVIDVIRAKTERGLRLAGSRLRGDLRNRLRDIRSGLISVLAVIEAYIDFPEEDIERETFRSLMDRLEASLNSMESLLDTYEEGRVYREGIHVVIAGRPNVGKSSILNALLREKRAIVTAVPGTTRDVIEEAVNIRGIPVNLIDTAGIRETLDEVEDEGVRRARKKLSEADIILYVVDDGGIHGEDRNILDGLKGRHLLLVVNKTDLMPPEKVEEIGRGVKGIRYVPVCAAEERGLDDLKDAVYEVVVSHDEESSPQVVISRKRHKEALSRAAAAVSRAMEGMKKGSSYEFISSDIGEALSDIGELAGETTPDDVLDRIFSEFCIGK